MILTMHDVSLRPSADRAGSAGKAGKAGNSAGTLTLEGTVKTYRYMDSDEIAEFEDANAPKGGKKPKGGK